MQTVPLPIHGRGASHNPPNRFERLAVELDPDDALDPDERHAPTTVFLKDATRTLIAHNDSPDVGFDFSINPYRGCEHGCIYRQMPRCDGPSLRDSLSRNRSTMQSRDGTERGVNMISTARTEVNRQMESVVAQLEGDLTQGRVNIHLALMAGGIAGLVERQDIVRRVEAVISGLTVKDLLKGAITNIDSTTVDATRPIKLPVLEETARQHPACDDIFVLAQLTARNEPHVQWCLQGDTVQAAQAATTDVELEDVACTLAVMGELDRAIRFIDDRPVRDYSKKHVRFIVLLEKCRRHSQGFIEEVHNAGLAGDGLLRVIIALAGRLPWLGYPYSDW